MDSGCQQSVVTVKAIEAIGLRYGGARETVTMLNGSTTESLGEARLRLNVDGFHIEVVCLVSASLVYDCSIILGMDGITKLGGVCIRPDSSVTFNNIAAVGLGIPIAVGGVHTADEKSVLEVVDSDFSASFDGEKWWVRWKWKGAEPVLTNTCSQYKVSEVCQEAYNNEIEDWIREGWLEPHKESVHGPVEGVIPLMAVLQPNKQRKVRPVMDYGKELNDYISCNPGKETVVCQEKLRDWRRLGNKCSMLDLKKAYLQLHVETDLQRFQAVKYSGRLYVMTRMGFGLNVAPKIMSVVLARVLSLDGQVDKGTDHYIDDIIVNEDVVAVDKVRSHLQLYGLSTKEPEPLCNARVLGLRVSQDASGSLYWKRDNVLVESLDSVTKRDLFSICGRLTGHYPVGGWLRVACSFMKRQAGGCSWDEPIPDAVERMLKETVGRLDKEDPVCGKWSVLNAEEGEVWCDASSLAIGAVVRVGQDIIEDGSWLRKDDGNHINVAELEAVIKGMNMGVKWSLRKISVYTDSATVYGWVRSAIEDGKRPKVNGLGEMLVRRRLGMIAELIEAYGLLLDIKLVRSCENIADKLTRVPKKWMVMNKGVCAAPGSVGDGYSVEKLRELHDTHHLGVERTLHSAQKMWGSDVTAQDVKGVVADCAVCKQVDPSALMWERGRLDVAETWHRLASDVTHLKGVPYLTLVDCGPSRFALWRRLRNETADSVALELERIFFERGSPAELLTDNGPCYKSRRLNELLRKWKVQHTFSCAYRASGNGIVERNHRTVKRMVARSGGRVEEMLYYYNSTPNASKSVPMESIYQYSQRGGPDVAGNSARSRSTHLNPFRKGDVVFVRPPGARCTSVWGRGKVTGVVSNTTAEVDFVNRHVSDLRLCHSLSQSQEAGGGVEVSSGELVRDDATDLDDADEADNANDADDDSDNDGLVHDDADNGDDADNDCNPARERRPPQWLANFYTF